MRTAIATLAALVLLAAPASAAPDTSWYQETGTRGPTIGQSLSCHGKGDRKVCCRYGPKGNRHCWKPGECHYGPKGYRHCHR